MKLSSIQHVVGLLLLLLASCADAFQLPPSSRRAGAVAAAAAPCTASSVAMMAKKQQQKPKKRMKKKKVAPRPALSGPPPSQSSAADIAPPPSLMSDAAPRADLGAGLRPDQPLDTRLDTVLQRAGISQKSESLAGMQRAGSSSADPLARIPKAGQELLERFFGGGALVFGTAFILSGLAIAVESIAKVLGSPLPTFLDELLVQYVEPALTPSILILFGFSISLGILKQVRARMRARPGIRTALARSRLGSPVTRPAALAAAAAAPTRLRVDGRALHGVGRRRHARGAAYDGATFLGTDRARACEQPRMPHGRAGSAPPASCGAGARMPFCARCVR